jgi:hypothetical protein
MDDLNIDFQSIFNDNEIDNKIEICENQNIAACFKAITKNVYRKAYSEVKLFDILGIDILQNGYSYHCLSGGDIDSLSYIKYILRQQKIEYLIFSTWCMANDDVELIGKWLDSRLIGRVDAYVGEIFPNQYKDNYIKLSKIMKKHNGRICVAKNHSKIYAGKGEKYSFGIESSANINTNPRIENTVITINEAIYLFYKEFFDGLKSFNRDFDEWVKY